MPMFSLRKSLEKQGVTDPRRIAEHMAFVGETIVRSEGRLDITKYRVDKKNPNGPIPMG